MDLRKSTQEKKDNNPPDYANFLRVFRPSHNAPAHIKSTISIDLKLFKEEYDKILEKSKDNRVNLTVKESSAGKIYTVYDTFQRDKQVKTSDHSPDRDDDDDMPY